MSTSLKQKRCLYDLYAPCDHTKCKREHRHNVFDEKQTSLRSHIKEKRICVAFMLFGKCSHESNRNTKSKYYKYTHLSLRELKQKLFGARGRSEVKLHEVVTKVNIQTISNKSPKRVNIELNQINTLNLQISELESKLQEQKTLISSLQDRIDNLSIVKEPAVSTECQTEVPTNEIETQTETLTNEIETQTEKFTNEIETQTEKFMEQDYRGQEILEELLTLRADVVFPKLIKGVQEHTGTTTKQLLGGLFQMWDRYLEDLNKEYIKEEVARRTAEKKKKKGGK